MPFSCDIADEVLVRCARRCCICRRFCGTKMQLHHIIQEADGGSNTLNNCIPLCLDCHQEVVAYNPKHPIGRKFSSDELKRHRDLWFDFVERHPERLNQSPETFFIPLPIGNSQAQLSEAAQKLLMEASASVDGFVSKHESDAYGAVVNTHTKNQEFLGKPNDNRARALWLDAYKELVRAGCFEPTSHQGIFMVTNTGYVRADALKQPPSH